MSFVSLWSPAWQTGADFARPELAAHLLAHLPRVTVRDGVIWGDARGFTHAVLPRVAELMLAELSLREVPQARAGVADTPVAAYLASRTGSSAENRVTMVAPGNDRAFIAPFPLDALGPDPRLANLLRGIGVSTCGSLAALERESVEVRLGAEATALWRLARADDLRAHGFFPPLPPELPHASLDWVEYALKDPARLLFVLNALLERVCGALTNDGQGAREFTITFSLTDRSSHDEVLGASRPTANRRTWLRLIRTRLENLRLKAAVTGVTLRASRVMTEEALQTDLFDRGLASASATEDAIARLVEDQGEVVVTPVNSAHPLLDRRTIWKAAELRRTVARAPSITPQLTLQLMPQPLPITVETTPRRDHAIPLRYRDKNGWHEVVQAAGPDRVSGHHWDEVQAYGREYYRCVTDDGVLVWLYRDGRAGDSWYFHGWWD